VTQLKRLKQLSTLLGGAALAAVATLTITTPATAQTKDPARIATAVDSLVTAALQDGRTAGLSVAVSLGGRPVITKGYGYADLEWKVPTAERTVYQVGSVTKQFTAAAIMQLVEQKKIDLDADVTTYLPDYNTQGRRIPVRRLLDHTSGLKDYLQMPVFHDQIGMKPLPRDTLVKLFSKEPFDFEPGEMEKYTNSGYFLLGLIIEKVSGRSYQEYVREYLFERAGMKDSRYCSETAVVPNMAHGYEMSEHGLRHSVRVDHTWPYAGGSLCATVADLDAWNQALHGGKVLSPAAYNAMITPGTLNDGSPLQYAKGIAVSDIGGHRALHHGGILPGFFTYVEYFPEDSLSIAVAINSQGPVQPDVMARTIAEIAHGAPVAKAAPPQTKTADYVGEYRGKGGYGEDLVLKVAADPAGRLTIEGPLAGPPGPPRQLAYARGETFQLDDKQLTFVRQRGLVTKLRVDAVYVQMVLKRAE
jgi:CubicO group peptidase (beta-lactamase class C family)